MSTLEARREYYAEQAATNGFVAVNFNVSGADIQPIFDGFADVLDLTFDTPGELGQHICRALHSTLIGREEDSASFIEQRRVGKANPYEPSARPSTEDKDTLHYTPFAHVHAHHYFGRNGNMPTALRKLLRNCAELQHEITEAVRPVFEDLGIADRMIAPAEQNVDNVHLLRILRYPALPQIEDEVRERAELHFDRSRFTAAVWEDCPGLVGAPANNGFGNPTLTTEEFDAMCQRALGHPISHHSGELKLFAGAGINRFPPEIAEKLSNWPPLLHGVIDRKTAQEATPRDRFAVVQFMNEHYAVPKVHVPTRHETGATAVREFLADRQTRYGAPVSP